MGQGKGESKWAEIFRKRENKITETKKRAKEGRQRQKKAS